MSAVKFAVATAALGFTLGAVVGWTASQDRMAKTLTGMERARADQAQAVVRRTMQAAAVTAGVEQRHASRRAVIEIHTKDLLRKAPLHVPPSADLRFKLPVGFVRLHDAAASGLDLSAVPDPAGRTDDAASDLAPSVAAGVIIDNYGACRATTEQLSALQDWARIQSGGARKGGD